MEEEEEEEGSRGDREVKRSFRTPDTSRWMSHRRQIQDPEQEPGVIVALQLIITNGRRAGHVVEEGKGQGLGQLSCDSKKLSILQLLSRTRL